MCPVHEGAPCTRVQRAEMKTHRTKDRTVGGSQKALSVCFEREDTKKPSVLQNTSQRLNVCAWDAGHKKRSTPQKAIGRLIVLRLTQSIPGFRTRTPGNGYHPNEEKR